MYNARGKSKANGKGGIKFPALECWNPMTKVASIAAEVDGRRVMCRISAKVLEKKFGLSDDGPMRTVVENRPAIEAAARVLIERTAFDESGAIIVGMRDL
ncbi:MAG: DUF1488 domain-containing protein [Gammaproteobacteria bacterium]|nr:DUF1488 domain-containing protein [Gammaproteobacteria bacterium]